MTLTLKQKHFIDSYLANGGRAKDAALEAGYAEGSAKQREEVLNEIVATATADGPSVDVILEEEKGSSGKLLAEAVRRRLETAGAGMVPLTVDQRRQDHTGLRARRMRRRREPHPRGGTLER